MQEKRNTWTFKLQCLGMQLVSEPQCVCSYQDVNALFTHSGKRTEIEQCTDLLLLSPATKNVELFCGCHKPVQEVSGMNAGNDWLDAFAWPCKPVV